MSDKITFVHLPLDLRALYRLAAKRCWGERRSFDEGRALHHALTEVFGPKTLQPFRLMVPPGKRNAIIYAYSTLAAPELRQNMEISPPDIQAVFNCSAMCDKLLPTRFETGRRLGFDIRLRPICRFRKQKSVKPCEMDIYQRQAELHGSDEGWHRANNRETVYVKWLKERLASAAEVEEGAILSRFQRSRASRNCHATEGPDAVIQGTLKVTSEAKFSEFLSKGVGRHKAYGYGMILLRPAGQPPLGR